MVCFAVDACRPVWTWHGSADAFLHLTSLTRQASRGVVLVCPQWLDYVIRLPPERKPLPYRTEGQSPFRSQRATSGIGMEHARSRSDLRRIKTQGWRGLRPIGIIKTSPHRVRAHDGEHGRQWFLLLALRYNNGKAASVSTLLPMILLSAPCIWGMHLKPCKAPPQNQERVYK